MLRAFLRGALVALLCLAPVARAAVSIPANGVGTVSSTTTSTCSPTIPNGVANGDILILVVGTPRGSTAASATGYSLKVDSATSGRLQLLWKRASGDTGGATVTVTKNASAGSCQIIAVRGALASGDPFDAVPASFPTITAGLTMNVTGITTNSSGTMLIHVLGATSTVAQSATWAQGTSQVAPTEWMDASNGSSTSRAWVTAAYAAWSGGPGASGAPTVTAGATPGTVWGGTVAIKAAASDAAVTLPTVSATGAIGSASATGDASVGLGASGTPGVGTNQSTMGLDYKGVSKFVVGSTTTYDALLVYAAQANGSVKCRAVVHNASGDSPSTWVATGREITGLAAGWNVLPFASPLTLTAGSYFQGAHCDTTVYWRSHLNSTAPLAIHYLDDTYADGTSTASWNVAGEGLYPGPLSAYLRSGVAATGAVATMSAAEQGGDAQVTLPVVSATGAVGTLSAAGSAAIQLTPVTATGAVVGSSATGGAAKTLATVSATGAIGAASAAGGAAKTLDTVSATGAIATMSSTGGAAKTLGTVSATGAVSNLSSIGHASVTLGTVAADGQIAAISAAEGATGAAVTLATVAATGEVASLAPAGGAAATLAPVASAAEVASIEAAGGAAVSLAPVSLEGALASLSAVSGTYGANVTLPRVSTSGSICPEDSGTLRTHGGGTLRGGHP